MKIIAVNVKGGFPNAEFIMYDGVGGGVGGGEGRAGQCRADEI